MNRVPTAEVSSESGQPLSAPAVELGFDRRGTLAQYPPSTATFSGVPAGRGARVRFAPALEPGAGEAGSDGVVFVMRCQPPEEEWREIYRELVTDPPEGADAPPAWQDREVSLASCGEAETTLQLETSCGPRNNCAADWARWGAPTIRHESLARLAPRQLVVLISIDTLRPERLRLYGGERATSTELERLAEDGVVFEQAVALAPWTIPSHATLLTSTYPRVHGANQSRAISDSVASVAEAFSRAGWQTAGFVDTPFLNRKFAFERGFQHYDDEPAVPGQFRRGASVVLERVLDWLSQADDRPAFVFWHVMDAHGPYGAAAPFGGRFRSELDVSDASARSLEKLRALRYHDYLKLDRFRSVDDLVASYDEGVAQTDAIVGRLFSWLRRVGAWDETLIVVTSDHGESFFDLDQNLWVGHGLFLTDDEIRVPLIAKLPRNRLAGRRIETPVSLLDVAPTLLAMAGLPPEPGFQGENLFAPRGTAAGDERTARPIFGHSSNVGASFVRTSEYHFIGRASGGVASVERALRPDREIQVPLEPLVEERLFGLTDGRLQPMDATDPGARARVERARALLEAHIVDAEARRENTGRSGPALAPEEVERLRALGYVTPSEGR